LELGDISARREFMSNKATRSDNLGIDYDGLNWDI
jgi:hypothetical protein